MALLTAGLCSRMWDALLAVRTCFRCAGCSTTERIRILGAAGTVLIANSQKIQSPKRWVGPSHKFADEG